MSTWADLANSPRWRSTIVFIRNWIEPFDSDKGMEPDELDSMLRVQNLTLPTSVREWYLLARNWEPVHLNLWIGPEELLAQARSRFAASEGLVCILTDPDGVLHFCLRLKDLHADDPPVCTSEEGEDEIRCEKFSEFVAQMTVNDVISDYRIDPSVELDANSVRAELTPLFPSTSPRFFAERFFADGPLESATIVAYTYGEEGPAFGKSRASDRDPLFERLRKHTS
jgi:hypothetical protein